MMPLSMIRCLDALDILGMKYTYISEFGIYSFSYSGVEMSLKTSTGEGGITLSAEFLFNSICPACLMRYLEAIVCREYIGYVVSAVSPVAGVVAKEWLMDWEKELSGDDMEAMLDETVQIWHTITLKLGMIRACYMVFDE